MTSLNKNLAPGKKLARVTEPDEKLVHYDSVGTLDQVTLCGLTDWIGRTQGKPTTDPVTCKPCKQIVKFVQQAAFENIRI